MARIYHLRFNELTTEAQKLVCEIDNVQLIEVGDFNGFRHGQSHEDIVVGDRTIFDRSLDFLRPVTNPNAVIIRDDHPMFSWIMLHCRL